MSHLISILDRLILYYLELREEEELEELEEIHNFYSNPPIFAQPLVLKILNSKESSTSYSKINAFRFAWIYDSFYLEYLTAQRVKDHIYSQENERL